MLLAASVPARPGERVLEAGTGAAAALLCLAARVTGLIGLGVERDPALSALAAGNIADNGFADRLCVVAADITALPETGPFDHACANPPWHDPAGTVSPDPARAAAKRGEPGLLRTWTEQLAGRLRPGGTLTLILAAMLLPEGLSALTAAGCGSSTVFPFWPKPERAAKLVLLQGAKGSPGPFRLSAGLVLHQSDDGYTPEAEAVLRAGEALMLR